MIRAVRRKERRKRGSKVDSRSEVQDRLACFRHAKFGAVQSDAVLLLGTPALPEFEPLLSLHSFRIGTS